MCVDSIFVIIVLPFRYKKCFLLNNYLLIFQDNVKETGEPGVEEPVLEGHLGIAKELLSFMMPEKKFHIGSDEKSGINLIKVILYIFVMNASHCCTKLRN